MHEAWNDILNAEWKANSTNEKGNKKNNHTIDWSANSNNENINKLWKLVRFVWCGVVPRCLVSYWKFTTMWETQSQCDRCDFQSFGFHCLLSVYYILFFFGSINVALMMVFNSMDSEKKPPTQKKIIFLRISMRDLENKNQKKMISLIWWFPSSKLRIRVHLRTAEKRNKNRRKKPQPLQLQ